MSDKKTDNQESSKTKVFRLIESSKKNVSDWAQSLGGRIIKQTVGVALAIIFVAPFFREWYEYKRMEKVKAQAQEYKKNVTELIQESKLQLKIEMGNPFDRYASFRNGAAKVVCRDKLTGRNAVFYNTDLPSFDDYSEKLDSPENVCILGLAHAPRLVGSGFFDKSLDELVFNRMSSAMKYDDFKDNKAIVTCQPPDMNTAIHLSREQLKTFEAFQRSLMNPNCHAQLT